MSKIEYNTSRSMLVMREYGRNIQKMVEYAKQIKDPEKRQKAALAIIDVMGQTNPHLRDIAEFKHTLWDHLFIMSNFELDVDSPYPKPEIKTYKLKPKKKLPYLKNKIQFKSYGKNAERMLEIITKMEDGPKKKAFIESLGNFMKMSHLQWNKETVQDDLIIQNIRLMSNGAIDIKDHSLSFNTVHQEKKTRTQRTPTRRGRK